MVNIIIYFVAYTSLPGKRDYILCPGWINACD